MFNNRYVGIAVSVVAGLIVLRVLGVSLGSLGLLAVVLACPLMMFFMMRSMGGMGRDTHDDHKRDDEHGRV
jgi:Protein of unknown function (DUF2933)